MQVGVTPLTRIALVAWIIVAFLTVVPVAQAGSVQIFGSPAYDSSTQMGFIDGTMLSSPGSCVNNTGTAAGYAVKRVSGSSLGPRAVRWYGGGGAAIELGDLGTRASGYTYIRAYAVNDTDTVVGYAHKYDGTTELGARAVRWDGGGTDATELGNLGTDARGYTQAFAYAVNNAGTAVGYARKYVGGSHVGNRAARWAWGGTDATELGNLGSGADESTVAEAYAVNDTGTAVGYANRYIGGNQVGYRAVRWDGGDTVATELGNLGTDASEHTWAYAYAVNDNGAAVGYAAKYVGGSYMGHRAVRWAGGATEATELDCLGTDADGNTLAYGYAVNDEGTAVGYASKYVDGNDVGTRAVRWSGGGKAATELGNLGVDASGYSQACAYAVGDAGTAAGYARKYVGGISQGSRAVVWGPDGAAVDLNDLIEPTSGWALTTARAMSDNGSWIAGEGTFDPDGAGPLAAYSRLWVMKLPTWGDVNNDGYVSDNDLSVLLAHWRKGLGGWFNGDFNNSGDVDDNDLSLLLAHWTGSGHAAIPDPATLALLALGGLAVMRRRRR